MTESTRPGPVIRGDNVQRIASPVVVAGGDPTKRHSDAMTVIPLLEGDKIEAFEVRCGCGASVIIECVYEEEQ